MPSSSLDFVDYFSSVEEPRVDRTKRHALMDVLFISVACALGRFPVWYAKLGFGDGSRLLPRPASLGKT